MSGPCECEDGYVSEARSIAGILAPIITLALGAFVWLVFEGIATIGTALVAP